MVIVSACLPLYFVGTSRAHLPPSRSSVTVFPVSHKRTCWRKTLAVRSLGRWTPQTGEIQTQVSSLVFPFFPSFFSFSFFPFSFHLVLLSNFHGLLVSCFLSLSLSFSNPLYSYPMNKELYICKTVCPQNICTPPSHDTWISLWRRQGFSSHGS